MNGKSCPNSDIRSSQKKKTTTHKDSTSSPNIYKIYILIKTAIHEKAKKKTLNSVHFFRDAFETRHKKMHLQSVYAYVQKNIGKINIYDFIRKCFSFLVLLMDCILYFFQH